MRKTIWIILALIVTIPLALAHWALRASLPRLSGIVQSNEIHSSVAIERDALGIPSIIAQHRDDLAYGIGFAHGQDRFFQMDLSRRLAAGELAELFGPEAREQDEKARIFAFRAVARKIVTQSSPRERALLESYARGVNAGLRSLRSRPWEYWVLRSTPEAWQAEDSILIVHAMWWDLQYNDIQREILRRRIQERAGDALTCFIYPARSDWDSPNPSGSDPVQRPMDSAPANSCPRIPPPEVLDLRGASTPQRRAMLADRFPMVGSNNWALAGTLTATGGALIAGDMHLNLRVPNIWYRARMRLKPAARTGNMGANETNGAQPLDLNGVTLPGAPLLVAGSNGKIAWSFTNSYGDWLDVSEGPCATEEGAILKRSPDGQRCTLVHWLAQVPEATNVRMLDLETVTSVQEALQLAPKIGIPQQNALIGDREGNIAWTIFGRIPLGQGAGRNSGHSGWITAADHPVILNPQTGRLWSANSLTTDHPQQQLAIGDDEARFGAGYDLGARTHQIHDALEAMRKPATARDMLAIQLDDRAAFLRRWQSLLLTLLDADALRNQPRRADFAHLVRHWSARASADAVGYRLVHAFRTQVEGAIWYSILTALNIGAAPGTSLPAPPARFEHALWRLVNEQPLHMLDARYDNWQQFLLVKLDDTIRELERSCGELKRCTWGQRNVVHIRHPLSRALPFLSRFIDMPPVELAGDRDMPRVQDGTFGASVRFAVTPGREAESYLTIGGGQSGHPLSPYYRSGFMQWARGEPLPFLPGRPKKRLTLQPRRLN